MHGALRDRLLLLDRLFHCNAVHLCSRLLRRSSGKNLVDMHGTVRGWLLRRRGDCAHDVNVHRPLRGGLLLRRRIFIRDTVALRGGVLWGDDGPHDEHVHGAVHGGLLRLYGHCAHDADVHGAVLD